MRRPGFALVAGALFSASLAVGVLPKPAEAAVCGGNAVDCNNPQDLINLGCGPGNTGVSATFNGTSVGGSAGDTLTLELRYISATNGCPATWSRRQGAACTSQPSGYCWQNSGGTKLWTRRISFVGGTTIVNADTNGLAIIGANGASGTGSYSKAVHNPNGTSPQNWTHGMMVNINGTWLVYGSLGPT